MELPDYILPVTDECLPRPYSVPKSEEEGGRAEIQRLIKLDVLEQIFDGEWASPAFS